MPVFQAVQDAQVLSTADRPIDRLEVDCASVQDWGTLSRQLAGRVASHVTVNVQHFDRDVVRAFCWPIAEANPTILWDLLIEGVAPSPAELRELREDWPHDIGYLDRVAVFSRPLPSPPWTRVTPRMALIVDLDAPVDPLAYEGIALVVWRLPVAPSSADLRTVTARGGDGIVVAADGVDQELQTWAEEQGLLLWRVPASVIV